MTPPPKRQRRHTKYEWTAKKAHYARRAQKVVEMLFNDEILLDTQDEDGGYTYDSNQMSATVMRRKKLESPGPNISGTNEKSDEKHTQMVKKFGRPMMDNT